MHPQNAARIEETCVSPAPNTQKLGLRMRLEVQTHGGAVVLHCHGQLVDDSEICELSAAVAEVLPMAHRMVVDLAEVEPVDSGGLGELVLLHMWARAAGYSLKFASPSHWLRQQMERTNLISVFEMYSSVARAVSALRDEELRTAQGELTRYLAHNVCR